MTTRELLKIIALMREMSVSLKSAVARPVVVDGNEAALINIKWLNEAVSLLDVSAGQLEGLIANNPIEAVIES